MSEVRRAEALGKVPEAFRRLGTGASRRSLQETPTPGRKDVASAAVPVSLERPHLSHQSALDSCWAHSDTHTALHL